MSKWNILFLIISFAGSHGFSESIRLPDETVTGEILRIEKSAIFTVPAPEFYVKFPEIAIPETEKSREGWVWRPQEDRSATPGRNYFSFSAGTHELLRADFLYRNTDDSNGEHSISLNNYFTAGHRDNSEEQKSSIALNWDRPEHGRFSFEFYRSLIGLPGRDSDPTDGNRKSFAFATEYSYLGKPDFLPTVKQSFYNVGDVEANFLRLGLQTGKTPIGAETILERFDAFGDFSTTSLCQELTLEKGRLTVGGGVKFIEDRGARFLPILRYSVNDNCDIELESLYRVPDLYGNVASTNYMELTERNLAPEEEYRLSASFNKKTEHTNFHLELSQAKKENFYAWADGDINGLLEPFAQQCWQTSVNITLEQHLLPHASFFLAGEKSFRSERIDFYPEETLDAGITFFSSSLFCKLWFSYTGERTFSEIVTDGCTTINAELKMLSREIFEWGIGIYNIADRDYYIVPGYPAEGRRFVAYMKMFL